MNAAPLRFALLALVSLLITSAGLAAPASPGQAALVKRIQSDTNLPIVLNKARELLKTGLTAGDGYGEVWIRDLNTFIELALDVSDRAVIRSNLLTFFKFQGTNGNIVDGFIPADKAKVSYKFIRSELAPAQLAHKNTVETDQETSLIQAVAKYVRVTGDRTVLEETIGGKTVRQRIPLAFKFLLTDRWDAKHGLVWGATTVDWGDVQPEHPWGVELDSSSHRTLDIYDNAMLVIALNDFLGLVSDPAETKRWTTVRDDLAKNIRRHLWDTERRQFIPHIYLEGSPFPADFDERSVYYHGGTAVAIEAGLLSREETKAALERMRENVRRAGASSIGLTVFPVYPAGTFKNEGMKPWSYQNGGDWCWFGGRMIQQLIRHGFVDEAYTELQPMITRVVKHGDFYEWWTRDNQPRGSARLRGSAGVLGKAILMLQAWSREELKAGG